MDKRIDCSILRAVRDGMLFVTACSTCAHFLWVSYLDTSPGHLFLYSPTTGTMQG